MITIYPGWFIILSVMLFIFNLITYYFRETQKIFIIRFILCVLSLIIFLGTLGHLDKNFFCYSTSQIIEKEEQINSSTTKITSFRIIEKRKRNIFTGKWNNESTPSFEEEIINIQLKECDSLTSSKSKKEEM